MLPASRLQRRALLPRATEPGGSLSWRIGGLAGEGIDTAGDLFAKAVLRGGWHVWTTRHFPSRIRGGLTTYTTRIAGAPIAAPTGDCDVIVALHQDAVDVEQERLREDGVVLYDSGAVTPPEAGGERIWLPVDCTGIAKGLGEPRARNTVALGASARLLGVDLEVLDRVIVERFDAKAREHRLRATLVGRAGDDGDGGAASDAAASEPKVVTVNRAALRRGHAALADVAPLPMPERGLRRDAGRIFLSGNEAFAYGALAAGCRFYAGYPITPATTIMEYLAEHLPAFGGVCLQVEDELAAVNMAIGAGFTGVRALTASSGPGVSLMAEAMGLAESTETPLVIVDCMRPGPSTGMPTKTAQEDLDYLLAGGHGEAPRIVLAAEDLDAAFETAVDAFDLAERFQSPVYVALEAALSVGKGDTARYDLGALRIDRGKRFSSGNETPGAGAPRTGEGYTRYGASDDGVPLRAVPGDVGGRHYANSTEHGPAGYTTEDPVVRARMVDRRNRKLRGIDDVHKGAYVEGDPAASLGVVAFGATVPVVREAVRLAQAAGRPVALLVLRRLLPLPLEAVEAFLDREHILVAEANSTGQLLRHLRAYAPAAHKARSLLKYTGEPFTLADLLPHIMEATE